MEISIPEIISWVIVGSIAGGFVGSLLTGKKAGYGWFKNLGIGLIGGLIGGVLFIKLFKLDFGMSEIKVTLQDLVAAVLGALILLLALKIFGKKKPG
jgi:uncharacterized membrane protein YeaQ/YmgE (transglycosylase-associated protein family)